MEKAETDMKRLVYFFIRGNVLRGYNAWGPTEEVAPTALTP